MNENKVTSDTLFLICIAFTIHTGHDLCRFDGKYHPVKSDLF
jgi:hypothetical protein